MPTLQVETRDKASSASVERLRTNGVLPMALLAKDRTTKLIQAEREKVYELIHSIKGLNIFDVEGAGDGKVRVIMKEVQRDPVSRKVIHMTVQQVEDTDVIRVKIPIRVEGTPVAVSKRAATLMVPMNDIEVKGRVNALPDEIFVDASKMKQNDRIAVGDLAVIDGVEYLSSPDAVIATTKQLRGMADMDGDAEEAEETSEGEANETSEEASAE